VSFQKEIQTGKRFEFGKNWSQFLSVLNEDRILESEKALREFLQVTNLQDKTFLDIGSGSGLSSLAAKRLGAEVRSFDYDPDSVQSTKTLKKRFFPEDEHWTIEEASVLDRPYIESLGQFDICYSWGVLHHTDSLWRALYNAHLTVKDDGYLFIAIYNDQGIISSAWELIKKIYCSGPIAQLLTKTVFYTIFFVCGLLIDAIKFQNPKKRYAEHKKHRGMSLIHDWKDWLGGYPYEPEHPRRVISFYENLGYELCNFKEPVIGFGNNQFLFKKIESKREDKN